MPTSPGTPRFAGKTAVITAAASGIGLATALRFLHEGATVLASDKDLDALQKTSRTVATPPARGCSSGNST
jgi:NAD(P)-dependent dehydrogenase (short-subunit alcohol dehydrogenase family)